MRYALHLREDNRILSATYEGYGAENDVIVDSLPDGDVADFKYVDGGYIYDPVPKEPDAGTKPTLEDRVADMEEAFDMILSGVTE